MKRASQTCTLLCAIHFLYSVNAYSSSLHFSHDGLHPVVTLSAGAAWNGQAGSSQYFPSPNPVQDSYYNYQITSHNQISYVFGGFFGIENTLNSLWKIQAGISYYQPSGFSASGYVTQGPAIIESGQPDTNASSQYSYHYNIKSQQVLAESKLLYTIHETYHPYVSAGLGVAFNQAYSFSVAITPPDTTLSNHFQNQTTNSFSYSLGLGIDMDITPHVRVGLGYRFADLGRNQTGTSIIDSGGTNNDGTYNPPVLSNNRLKQSHLYTNSLLAQLTFLIF